MPKHVPLQSIAPATLRAAAAGQHAPAFLHDGGGLYLKIAQGSASWLLRYSFAGQKQKMGLGGLRDVPAATARRLAAEARETLAAGKDPKVQRVVTREAELATQRRQASDSITFETLARQYLDGVIDTSNYTASTKRSWRSSMRDHVFPHIGRLTFSEIDRGVVLDVLRRIWSEKNVTAQQVRHRIECIFEEARHRRITELPNPATWEEVRRGLSMYAPAEGGTPHAALPWREVPQFYRRLKASNGDAARALRLAILAISRTQEALGARFEEFAKGADGQLIGGIWTVPAERMKGKPGKRRPHFVPITDAIADLYLDMEARRRTVFLFPHRSKPTKSMSRSSLTMLLTTLGVRGSLTVHGFRSTFKDWCSDHGFDEKASERQLAHKVTGVKGHYDRTVMLDMRHDLMQRWADFVTGKTVMAKPSAGPKLQVVGGREA
jgi:integrase